MKQVLAIILFLVATATPVMATSWAYSFVVYNNSIYVITEEPVEEVGNRLGEVTAYSDMENLSGNFSNVYEVGTPYYEIKGVDPAEAIAVEKDNGYIRATFEVDGYESSTQLEMTDPVDEPLEIIGSPVFKWLVIIVAIVVLALVFVVRRKDK